MRKYIADRAAAFTPTCRFTCFASLLTEAAPVSRLGDGWVGLYLTDFLEKDALWNIVGMAEGEDAEVARQHDRYLYGA